jgi:hypothetical protein
LYLVGSLLVHHATDISHQVTIVSCLVSDILASALSPTIPITSCHEASSLIKWKLDHAFVPEYRFPLYPSGKQKLPKKVSSTVWRHRWVFVTQYHRDEAFNTSLMSQPYQLSLSCNYYDTTNDQWTLLADIRCPSLLDSVHIEVKAIHDQLYVYYPRAQSSVVMVYNEMDDKWDELPNINNPKRESIMRLLPAPSLPSLSSSRQKQVSTGVLTHNSFNNKTNSSNNGSDKYMTIVGIDDQLTYAMFEQYDTINCQLNGSSKWSLPKWIEPVSSLLIMINDEWLLWAAYGGYVNENTKSNHKWRHGIVRLNDVNDDKKWRWWGVTPNGNGKYDESACD